MPARWLLLIELMRRGATHFGDPNMFCLEMEKPLGTYIQTDGLRPLAWNISRPLGLGVDDEGPALEPKLGCATGV